MIRRVIITDDIEMITTLNECGYTEVLDDFTNAEYVNIVTFNISARREDLIDRVKALDYKYTWYMGNIF